MKRHLGLPFPWAMAILSGYLLTVSSANYSTFGVFFKPMIAELDWTRAELSGSLAVRSLVMAALAAPMGALSERYRPRWVVAGSIALVGVAYLLFARVTTLWQLYLVQGLLMGMAMAGPFVVLTSAVGKWHQARRGLALGIVSVGGGLSYVIFPALSGTLLQSMDWRAASSVIGLSILVAGVPASMAVRSPPLSQDEQMHGRPAEQKGLFGAWGLLPQFLKNQAFLTMTMTFFLFAAATGMVTAHFVNYATDSGVPALTAAAMMSAWGFGSVAGRLGIGIVSDRTGVKAAVVLCLALLTGALVLMNWNVALWALWLSVVFFGFGVGGEWPLVPGLVGATFGTARMATITGLVLTTTFVGSALGPYLGGFVFDLTGSYFWALAFAAGFVFVALGLSLRLRTGK